MFQYLNWVSELQGISPVARLLGFRMANYAVYYGDGFHLGPSDPACQIDLDAALAWIGCTESELRSAIDELILEGVEPLRIDGANILYSFPLLDEEKTLAPSRPKKVDPLTIYVITAQGHVVKIGVSKYPQYRLDNLQAANPTQRLILAWSFEGPSPTIRRIERSAHAKLAQFALGREWFSVSAEIAIETVRRLLEEAGIRT